MAFINLKVGAERKNVSTELCLHYIQADQIEIQLKLIKRTTRRSKTLSLSPSVSPVGSPVPPWPRGPSPEVETPAQMTSHQRSHIAPSSVDGANNTSVLPRHQGHQGPDTTSTTQDSLVVRLC